MMAMMLSTTALAMASRTSTTALPTCGVSVTFVSRSERRVDFGFVFEHVEAGAGDAVSPISAASSAASSTMAPRAVLMRKAVGFISAISRAPII